jgi:hypothetical protein
MIMLKNKLLLALTICSITCLWSMGVKAQARQQQVTCTKTCKNNYFTCGKECSQFQNDIVALGACLGICDDKYAGCLERCAVVK